mgnify:CR=1 FL=1
MSYADKLERHMRLMSRMAAQNGAELTLARQVGLISVEEIDRAALSCTECVGVDDCETHLESRTPGFPSYCRNVAMLQCLAGDMAEFGLTDY